MIFGGIYGGVFTPTEAAGVAVVYSLVVTIFIYREVDLARLWRILMSSSFLISQILLIVTSAGIYSWLLTTSGIPQQIVVAIKGLHLARWELLLILNIGLLLAGSFLEPPAAILILTPLLLPIVRAVGVNPIHFGIIVAVNLSVGMYTPPFGLESVLVASDFQCAAELHLSGCTPVSRRQFHRAAYYYLYPGDFDGFGQSLIERGRFLRRCAVRNQSTVRLLLSGGIVPRIGSSLYEQSEPKPGSARRSTAET